LGNGGSSYTPAIPEDLITFTLNKTNSSTNKTIFNYYRNANNSQIGVLVGTNDNSEKIFSKEKDIDYVRIGTLYYKWSGKVDIGGEQLYLYGKNGISIITDNNPNYENRCTLSCTKDGVKFANFSDTKSIFLPYGTDLTNIQNKSTTLENKATFRQSIIDHTTMNNPYNTLKETITSNEKYSTTMKTLVDENIFPKTTHSFLTCYYT
jgi:hypothetical protein